MRVKTLLLVSLSIIIIAASVFLFIFRSTGSTDKKVLSYDQIKSMSSKKSTYHSINNWETEEDTGFVGVALYELLESLGIDEENDHIRVIAPDEYFWPAVGTVLTLKDLKRCNGEGLYPILAFEMNGEFLDPEPDGTGPLRLVMPQYREDEINKPSWVSNVRLIEVGPLEGTCEIPDPGGVPLDEIWIYGNIYCGHPFPFVLPLLILLVGVALLAGTLLYAGSRKRRIKDFPQATAVVFLVIAIFGSSAWAMIPSTGSCRADPGLKTFTSAELTSMPAFAGHYTFLKSQPPYTYYEADYRGVPLSCLVEEKMRLEPGASEVVVRARDGYSVSLSLSQVRATYPGGLKVIIAYEKNGQPITGEEGSLRLIVPQNVQGSEEQGGDPNTPLCARMVYAIEVQPLPQGEQPPEAGTVSGGSLAVYGAVSEPAVILPPEEEAEQPQTPVHAEPQPEKEAAVETGPEQAPGATEEPAIVESLDMFGERDPRLIRISCMALHATLMNPFSAFLPLIWLFHTGGAEQ